MNKKHCGVDWEVNGYRLRSNGWDSEINCIPKEATAGTAKSTAKTAQSTKLYMYLTPSASEFCPPGHLGTLRMRLGFH